ncbi:hypothetical protein E5Q_04871 [Mixia osmundae IAM 14324]|uniref:Uncharacterized protein n=1 Tax=Mixia osmundae (strain CBS 9802 / IAM 14324 / JCM 22182 / KY 12970) TaxID=764103 RepID=G7E5S8_MIXOS|nr:hypothetical protein E5Q_04871 [Mixia osmundae IAM 14324]
MSLILLFALLGSLKRTSADHRLSILGDSIKEYCLGLECVAICRGSGVLDERAFHYSVVANLPQVLWKIRVYTDELEKSYCHTFKGQSYAPSCHFFTPTKASIDSEQWLQAESYRGLNIADVAMEGDPTGYAAQLIRTCCAAIWEASYYLNYRKRDVGLPQVFWKTRVFARNLETPYCYTLDGQPWPPTFNIGPPAKKSIDPNQWIQVGCLRAMNTIEIGVTDDETGIAKELIFNCCTPIWRGTYYANYAKRDIGVGDPTVQLACGPSQYREPGHRETCGRIFPEFRESTPCLMTTHCYPTYESAGEGGCVKRLRPKPFNPM